MSVPDLDYREHDRQFWEEEPDEFVSQRVFDAHFHLFINEHLEKSQRTEGPKHRKFADAAWTDGIEWASTVYPVREPHFLVLAMPLLSMDLAAHNYWLADQVKVDPCSLRESVGDTQFQG